MKRILPFASASLLAASMMIAPALAQDKLQQQDPASGAASGSVEGSGSAGASTRKATGQETTGSTSQGASSEQKMDQQAGKGVSRDQGEQTGATTSGENRKAGAESSGQDQQAGAESGKQDRQAGEKQDMKAGAEQSGDQDRQAESGSASGTNDSAQTQGTSNETTASINITNEQQTELHTVFTETKVEPVEQVDFDINVGVAVPDTITLHPLPPRVVTIVPAYEGYEYFVLPDGRIVIVQPDTLEIVYILA